MPNRASPEKPTRQSRIKVPGLTRQQFAQAVPLPPSHVDRMMERGELETVQLGDRVRILPTEVSRIRRVYRMESAE